MNNNKSNYTRKFVYAPLLNDYDKFNWILYNTHTHKHTQTHTHTYHSKVKRETEKNNIKVNRSEWHFNSFALCQTTERTQLDRFRAVPPLATPTSWVTRHLTIYILSIQWQCQAIFPVAQIEIEIEIYSKCKRKIDLDSDSDSDSDSDWPLNLRAWDNDHDGAGDGNEDEAEDGDELGDEDEETCL